MSHCRKKQTTEYFAFTARARGRGQAGVKYFQSRLGSSGTVDNINSQTATAFHIIGIKVGQRRPALFHPDTRTRSILIPTTTFPYCCVPTVHTGHRPYYCPYPPYCQHCQHECAWSPDNNMMESGHSQRRNRISICGIFLGDKYLIIPFRIYLVWRRSWMDIISFNLSVIE